jgi:hypothetical protein
VERTGHEAACFFTARYGPPFTTTLEGFMIDRPARNRLAQGIRHLAAGVVTNIEFEDRALSPSADPAVQAVFLGGPWFLYHDVARYKLRGAHRLSPAVRREAARWVLFLKSDLPYEWPIERRGILGSLAWIGLNLVTVGFFARHAQRRFAQHGDIAVWPFIRHSDYEAALAKPPYLGKPSNPRLQATRMKPRAPEPGRVRRAWRRTIGVQVPEPGIGGAEG